MLSRSRCCSSCHFYKTRSARVTLAQHWFISFLSTLCSLGYYFVYMYVCLYAPFIFHTFCVWFTEEEGRDLSCLAASLVQVMLDPYFRTIVGFQSLIQKEWVMAGYQFLDRCNHLKRSDKEVRVTLSDSSTVLNIYSQKKAKVKMFSILWNFLKLTWEKMSCCSGQKSAVYP